MKIEKPGSIIRDALKTPEQHAEFQSYCDEHGINKEGIFNGTTPVNHETAVLLGTYFSVNYRFWIIEETQYQTRLEMLKTFSDLIEKRIEMAIMSNKVMSKSKIINELRVIQAELIPE